MLRILDLSSFIKFLILLFGEIVFFNSFFIGSSVLAISVPPLCRYGQKEKEPKIALSDSFLFVSYYFTLTEGSCSALFLPYCILMFNQKMFYYFPLKMIISFQYIIFISSILLHRCNTRSLNDNNSQIPSLRFPCSTYIHSTDSILLIATFSSSFII